jgi:hypothetical protein
MYHLQTEAKDMTTSTATARCQNTQHAERLERRQTDLADAGVADEKKLEEVVVFACVHG